MLKIAVLKYYPSSPPTGLLPACFTCKTNLLRKKRRLFLSTSSYGLPKPSVPASVPLGCSDPSSLAMSSSSYCQLCQVGTMILVGEGAALLRCNEIRAENCMGKVGHCPPALVSARDSIALFSSVPNSAICLCFVHVSEVSCRFASNSSGIEI